MCYNQPDIKMVEVEESMYNMTLERIKELNKKTASQWEEISRLKMLVCVLRQEVKAWRKVNDLHQFIGWMEVNEDHERAGEVENATKATDAANALEER